MSNQQELPSLYAIIQTIEGKSKVYSGRLRLNSAPRLRVYKTRKRAETEIKNCLRHFEWLKEHHKMDVEIGKLEVVEYEPFL